MILRRQLLDYTQPWALPDVYLFTGNPIRRADGAIVMGRGAARVVRDAYPGIDKRISTDKPVTYTEITPGQWIGWFQVKAHWRDPADLRLIQASTELLTRQAAARPAVTFHLNAPGVGNGRLSWDQVEQILASAPDNVVCYLAP